MWSRFLFLLPLLAACASGPGGSVASSYGAASTVSAYSYDVRGGSASANRAFSPAPENAAARELGLPVEARACYDQLWHLGVTFELVHDAAAGVRMPILLRSPVGGIEVHPANDHRTHAVIDCRLALRIFQWSAALRGMGVRGIEHYSVYRPGARVAGSGKRSGHASALAIDLARLELDNGAVVDVLADWEDRARGESPCPVRADEGSASRLLREAVCSAVDQGLFQVVLTPHHDRAHQNHVHLELRPGTSWTYVR